MENGVSYLALALGVGLLTETLFAHGQTLSPTLVAQAPAVPPSGVLVTQPPAPSPCRLRASGDAADDRAPNFRHRAGQDGTNGADC